MDNKGAKRPPSVGANVSIDFISDRFCDGTDIKTMKKKKQRGNAWRRNRQDGFSTMGNNNAPVEVHEKAAPRYFLLEGRLSSGFLHFRAFLFNDVLLLATPDDSVGPYFLAKQVYLWPPRYVVPPRSVLCSSVLSCRLTLFLLLTLCFLSPVTWACGASK